MRIVAGLTMSAEDCERSGYVGGCVVARRSLSFVEFETLSLPIVLEASCIDVPCGTTETCRSGVCVSAVIEDPRTCATDEGCDVATPATAARGGGGGRAGAGGWESTNTAMPSGGVSIGGGSPPIAGGTTSIGRTTSGEGGTGGIGTANHNGGAGPVGGAVEIGGSSSSQGGSPSSNPDGVGGSIASGGLLQGGATATSLPAGGSGMVFTGGGGLIPSTSSGGTDVGGNGGTVASGGASIDGGATSTSGGQYGGAVSAAGSTLADGRTSSAGATSSGGNSGAGAPTSSGGTGVGVAGSAGASLFGFTIDRYEVTRAEYAAWVATSPNLANQPAECSSSNTSFVPTCEWPPDTKGNYPVVCVDWCDAHAYCVGVGRRLCGKIGGGTNTFAAFKTATLSQWYAICTTNGQYTYPYGNAFNNSTCNGSGAGYSTTLPVGTLGGCHPAHAFTQGVVDLSGNVAEWEDSCRNSDNACRLRGGSFDSSTSLALSCATDAFALREYKASDVGFRCCSSP